MDEREVSGAVAILVDARAQYPSVESGSHYDEVMAEVQTRVSKTGDLGKGDIGALLLWKRLNLSSRWTRELNELPDAHVRKITGKAIELVRGSARSIPDAASAGREVLLALPGCKSGPAVASTLLTAGAPDRMAVYDRRAVIALRKLGFTAPGRYSRYMVTLCDIVARVEEHTSLVWCPRDVDMALFILGGRK